jgi:hypothetical protein
VLLRRLDERVLPRLARGLRRVAGGRARMRVLLAAALTAGTVLLIAAVWARDKPVQQDLSVGEVVRVGVPQGQSIPGYVATSRRELAALPPTAPATYALVTFSAYLTPARLAPMLDGVELAIVYVRVPLKDTQTEIVRITAFQAPDDVITGMAQVAARKQREADNYRALRAKLTGAGEQERNLRAVYAGGARVAAAEASAYRKNCSCVYAAVVRGPAPALARLAARAGVRAVDPAPEVQRLERAVFLPPLPEQARVARPPADSRVKSPHAFGRSAARR